MFFIITAAIAPALALLSFFYLRNEMFTEPRRTLLSAFVYGAVITFPVLFIQYVLHAEGVCQHSLDTLNLMILMTVFYMGLPSRLALQRLKILSTYYLTALMKRSSGQCCL